MAKIKNPLIVVRTTSSGGAAYRITTAELPATTINLLQNGTIIDTKTTDATTGGKVSFDVAQLGTYEVSAVKNGATLWTNSVDVNNIGEFIVKSGKALNDYTPDEMHTALQGAYFSTMFSIYDTFTLVKESNLFNNQKFFVEKITQSNGKEIVDFRAVEITATTYNYNQKCAYLSSETTKFWSSSDFSNGGYKYSDLRLNFMKMGETVYTQAKGIKPDNSAITDGIPFSQMKYTNNDNVSAIYSYNRETDTMTPLTEWQAISNKDCYFVKGYFKNVGTIDETTFNAGNYYTNTPQFNVYTLATTYESGTTYYGFYEKLQEDGIFADALNTAGFGSNLVRFNEKASAGMPDNYLNELSDYVDLPAVEEIVGLNKTTVLLSGITGESKFWLFNPPGEGSQKPAYNNYYYIYTGAPYWTRSVGYYSTYGNVACMYISGQGYPYWASPSSSKFGVKIGFRLA